MFKVLLLYDYFYILRGNQLLVKYSKKLYEVIRAAFQTVKHPAAPIHNAALTFITNFPWVVCVIFLPSIRLIKLTVIVLQTMHRSLSLEINQQ